uniref:Uncharacterized protein n=1 Tax=Leptospira santarosai serovar Arenal str. MAVJ 401 TaxID=1049976 RepID=M6JQM0_9LEPT|nr:hypothetical protein LEP1GSC063_3508 [Leptospira santarosai serovar Arenal str. MAVJ 401]
MESQDSNFIRIDRGENLEMIRIDTFEKNDYLLKTESKVS